MLMILLLAAVAHAQIEILPIDPKVMVQPGDVVDAKIQLMDESLVNQLKPVHWKKGGDSQLFLFMDVGPLEKDSSGWHQSGRLVLGSRFSPDGVYGLKVGERTLEVRFRGWTWNPQSAQLSPEFKYEDVALLSLSWWRRHWPWALGLALLLLAGAFWLARRIYLARLRTKQAAQRLEACRQELRLARTLPELSQLWLRRDELKALFPAHQQDIQALFNLLNQSQFKPQVSDEELKGLLAERDRLLLKLSGGQHGA